MSQVADCGILTHRVLLDERAEDVGDVLVERSRLVLVAEPRGALDHAVGELVPDDAERMREPAEHLAVAVAEDHAFAVPERVVVPVAVVHGGLEGHACIVDRVAGEDAGEHLERVAEAVVRLVDRGVARGWLAFASHEAPGQLVVALGVGDAPVGLRCRAGRRRGPLIPGGRWRGRHERGQFAGDAPLAQGLVAQERSARGIRCGVEPGARRECDASEQVGRHDRRVRRRMGVGPRHPRHATIVARPADRSADDLPRGSRIAKLGS